MPISQVHLDLLKGIQEEWDLAERDIKLSEQVSNGIILPAIKELRYAGRRIVDVIQEIHSSQDSIKIKSLLDDAYFDCLRARHDAIDAAAAKIAIEVEIMVEKLEYEAIIPAYPNFPAFVAELTALRDKIVASRSRRQDRVLIYNTVSAYDFPNLVANFQQIKNAEGIMLALAKRSRRDRFFGKWGLIVGIAGVILAIAVPVGIEFSKKNEPKAQPTQIPSRQITP